MEKKNLKQATIYDIAKLAGTSTASVSRVLSNSDYPISSEIRKRILDAARIMHGLISNNINVPEEISVIGFDNIEFSAMVNPSLTTINQPAFETGRIACKILIENLTTDEDNYVSFKMEPTLVERESVRNLKI